jgi:hypothetical protein
MSMPTGHHIYASAGSQVVVVWEVAAAAPVTGLGAPLTMLTRHLVEPLIGLARIASGLIFELYNGCPDKIKYFYFTRHNTLSQRWGHWGRSMPTLIVQRLHGAYHNVEGI